MQTKRPYICTADLMLQHGEFAADAGSRQYVLSWRPIQQKRTSALGTFVCTQSRVLC